MMTAVEEYLFPRVCPILAVSHEDLVKAIETHGRQESFNALASLIVKHYDFPYARFCVPRTPAPSTLGQPRAEGKPTPAPSTMLLGGYRCTRMSSSDSRIPGISLIMHDALSRLDWAFDTFMEPHRMKCWVAIQSKSRRWSDGRNDLRSPYSRATNPSCLAKLLDSELINPSRREENDMLLSHSVLRDIVIGSNEAIPPTVELYLQTISKLNPTSISNPVMGYGVGVAAMLCVPDIPCSYGLAGMTEESSKSLREFIQVAGSPITEKQSSLADLVFIDVIPYGTHDLRAYFGEKSSPRDLSYSQYIRKLLGHFRTLVEEAKASPPHSTSRIAVVVSLRELPTLPTAEPLLLGIMSDDQLAIHIDIAGALISQKRDYSVYLMLLHSSPRSGMEDKRREWQRRFETLYPELLSSAQDEMMLEVRIPPRKDKPTTAAVSSEGWDDVCLRGVMSKLVTSEPDVSGIALQGPRTVRGGAAFPTRTRSRVILSETNNLDTGDIAYVFGDVIEPPPPQSPPEEKPAVVISDPLLSRMVNGIREKISEG